MPLMLHIRLGDLGLPASGGKAGGNDSGSATQTL
jgi:hypothetical protein